jgi:hypothetical protein
MSPAGGRGCVPAYDRAPLRGRFPKNHWQSPASPQGPPAAPQRPTAAGYYAETGTVRDSGTSSSHPPSASLKREGSGPVIEDPRTSVSDGQRDSCRASPQRHVNVPPHVRGNGSRRSQWEQSELNFGSHQSHQPSFSGVRDGGRLILW